MSAPAPVSKSGSTVCVASKMPFPIKLSLQKSVSRVERDAGGEHKITSFVKDGKATVIIEGCARPVGVESDKHIAGGFALTHGVDADFWNEWVKQNQEFPPFVEGLIFATSKIDSTVDKAKEYKSLRSGFEPIDPASPPAEFAGKSGVAAA